MSWYCDLCSEGVEDDPCPFCGTTEADQDEWERLYGPYWDSRPDIDFPGSTQAEIDFPEPTQVEAPPPHEEMYTLFQMNAHKARLEELRNNPTGTSGLEILFHQMQLESLSPDMDKAASQIERWNATYLGHAED